MPELVAQDTKGAGGVAKTPGNFVGAPALDKVSAQGFVLPVQRLLMGEKKTGLPEEMLSYFDD